MDKTKVLVVVDMQNDFITGSLGSAAAQAIVPGVADLIRNWDGQAWLTQDTHFGTYPYTLEGKKLPVDHCRVGTSGWELAAEINKARLELMQRMDSADVANVITKPTFGSYELAEDIEAELDAISIDSITIVGLCTDICVVSNALMLRAKFPDVPIKCIARLCAGTSKENQEAALQVMRCCQIDVED